MLCDKINLLFCVEEKIFTIHLCMFHSPTLGGPAKQNCQNLKSVKSIALKSSKTILLMPVEDVGK